MKGVVTGLVSSVKASRIVQNSTESGAAAASPSQSSNMPPAGWLNRRVIIQKDISQSDMGGGTNKQNWQTAFTLWAHIQPKNAHEIFLADQLESQPVYVISIRYIKGITPAMQVKYKNHTFIIKTMIDLEESHEQIQLLCTELQSPGITQ